MTTDPIRLAVLAAVPQLRTKPEYGRAGGLFPIEAIDPYTMSLFQCAEETMLRAWRETGHIEAIVARVLLLQVHGHQNQWIAERVGVSRVTIAKWIDLYASTDIYTRFLGDDEFETGIKAPIINLLTPHKIVQLTGFKLQGDRFIVPEGFHKPLQQLWRIAYRARGPEATTDADVVAASNALDVLISLLLRRGVTNLAIAEAAGVTHRAVLARMARARARGLMLQCGKVDDSCENFYGEDQIKERFDAVAPSKKHGEWLSAAEIRELTTDSDGTIWCSTFVLTTAAPNVFWIKTLLRSPAFLPVPAMDVTLRDYPAWNLAVTTPYSNICIDEIDITTSIGRLGSKSATARAIAASNKRTSRITMPTALLYTESSARTGLLPRTPQQAVKHIPEQLWKEFFVKRSLIADLFVMSAVEDAEFAEAFPAITKHSPEAQTRVGNRAS